MEWNPGVQLTRSGANAPLFDQMLNGINIGGGASTINGTSASGFNLDIDLIKRVRITESKEFEIRIDAISVLNHPNFGNPQLNINSPNNDFGRITTTARTTAGSVGQAVGWVVFVSSF